MGLEWQWSRFFDHKSRKNVASHTSKFFPEMLIKVFLVINWSVARNNSIQFQDLADLFPFVNTLCITVCPTILPPQFDGLSSCSLQNGGPKFGGQSPNFSGFCGPKGPPTPSNCRAINKRQAPCEVAGASTVVVSYGSAHWSSGLLRITGFLRTPRRFLDVFNRPNFENTWTKGFTQMGSTKIH